MNDWFDAMNSRVEGTGRYTRKISELDLTAANSPLRALERCRSVFSEWRAAIEARPNLTKPEQNAMFIPYDKCWYDLQLTINGTLWLCKHYLKQPRYEGACFMLKTISQDVCEHHFSGTRARAGQGAPTAAQAARAAQFSGLARTHAAPKDKSNCASAPISLDTPMVFSDARKRRRELANREASAASGKTAVDRAANRVRVDYIALFKDLESSP
jgi:hypothetical protein